MAGTPEYTPQINNSEQAPVEYERVDERIDLWDIEPGLPFTPLRVAIFGKGPFANQLLEAVHNPETGHQVVAVIGPAKKPKDKDFDPVRLKAKSLGIPDYKFESMEDPNFKEVLEKHGADVFIGASLTAFMPQELAEMPELGAWGLHPSRLLADEKQDGDHRGGDAIQWQIYNGEEEIGLSIHAYGKEEDLIVPEQPYMRKKPLPLGSKLDDPNDNADKGPILAQSSVARGDVRTTTEVFPNKVVPAAVKLYTEVLYRMAVAKDRGLIFSGQPQIKGSGSYQPKMSVNDVRIDVSGNGQQQVNKIEAGSFGLPAWVEDANGDRIGMFDGIADPGHSETPGRFSGLTEMEEGKSYALLEVGDGVLKVGRFRKYPKDGPRGDILQASQFTQQENWEAGTTILH